MSGFKSGIGLLVKELDIKVVPVSLQGLYELKQRGQYFAPPGMVRVVFGEPVGFDTPNKPTEIAQELAHRVAALGRPERRAQRGVLVGCTVRPV